MAGTSADDWKCDPASCRSPSSWADPHDPLDNTDQLPFGLLESRPRLLRWHRRVRDHEYLPHIEWEALPTICLYCTDPLCATHPENCLRQLNGFVLKGSEDLEELGNAEGFRDLRRDIRNVLKRLHSSEFGESVGRLTGLNFFDRVIRMAFVDRCCLIPEHLISSEWRRLPVEAREMFEKCAARKNDINRCQVVMQEVRRLHHMDVAAYSERFENWLRSACRWVGSVSPANPSPSSGDSDDSDHQPDEMCVRYTD